MTTFDIAGYSLKGTAALIVLGVLITIIVLCLTTPLLSWLIR